MKKIESSQNPYFKTLVKCLKTPGIKKENIFMVMGSKIVTEAIENPKFKLESLLVTAGMHIPNKHLSKTLELEKNLFKELDIFETKSPIAVFYLPELQKWDQSQPNGLEIFAPIQDPSNLGAIIRSSAAFNINKIILLKECAHPFHPKTIRASSGMSLKCNFQIGPSIQELAKNPPENFVSLDMGGKNILTYKWKKNCSLIIGEEGKGVPEGLQKHSLSIPISEDCESLNASVATAIAMHEYSKTFPKSSN